jgi:hypothetical protein
MPNQGCPVNISDNLVTDKQLEFYVDVFALLNV